MQETQRHIDRSGRLPKSTSKCTTNKPQQQSGHFAEEKCSAEIMQWKQTRAFYTTSGWPDILPAQQNNFPLLGESVLVWMMLQPPLDIPWLRTYAWTEELNKVQLPPYRPLKESVTRSKRTKEKKLPKQLFIEAPPNV